MVIDDVRALPTAPIIVAEGSTVPASIVGDGIADRTRAVWLLPTEGFQQAQLAGHVAGARRLYSLLRNVIEQEARAMRVENPKRESEEFTRIQSRLSSGRPAASSSGSARSSESRPPGRVEAPSSQYRTYSGNNLFQVDVPDNWREMPSENSVWFLPEGAAGQIQGQTVFTHGVNVGVVQAQSW